LAKKSKKKKKKKKTAHTQHSEHAKKVFTKRRHSSGELSPSSLVAAADAIAVIDESTIVVSDVAARTRQLQLALESRRGKKRRSLSRCHDDANSSASEHSAGVSDSTAARASPASLSTPVKRAYLMKQRAHFHDVDEVELEVELVPDAAPDSAPTAAAAREHQNSHDRDGGENFGDSNRGSRVALVSSVSKPKPTIETASAAALAELLPRKKAPPRTFAARRKPIHNDTDTDTDTQL
jgi:hypothetical protein